MSTQFNQVPVDETARKAALNERLEGIGWAILLITMGTIWLLPETQVPSGTWLIAAGVILLGLNAVRAANGIRMSGFSLGVGVLALLAGLGEHYNIKLPLFPIALILIGVCLLFGAFRGKGISAPGCGWCCGWNREGPSGRATGQGAGE